MARRAFAASLLLVATAGCLDARAQRRHVPVGREDFTITTVASKLETPWDLAWGPDNMIWVSERRGRISRLDPASGRLTVAGTLTVMQSGESGLMGIAFHPDFVREPYLFAVHTYSRPGRAGWANRLVRMRWDGTSLGAPETLLEDIPASSIHDGSRLAIGPDDLLYMTTGDASDGGLAQDIRSLGGKILRLDLMGRPAPGNPFGSAVWSYGHRNPQGLVFHPVTHALYSTEHGPSDNDEINLIQRGGNYGWPQVHGMCDPSGPEREFCRTHNVIEPLATWTPTIAIAGADFYMSDRIPGWRGSLLATSLRGSALYRFTLSEDGTRLTGEEVLLANRYGRLRDVLVVPNGDVYVATSNRDGRGSPARDDDRILKLSAR